MSLDLNTLSSNLLAHTLPFLRVPRFMVGICYVEKVVTVKKRV